MDNPYEGFEDMPDLKVASQMMYDIAIGKELPGAEWSLAMVEILGGPAGVDARAYIVNEWKENGLIQGRNQGYKLMSQAMDYVWQMTNMQEKGELEPPDTLSF